MQITVKFWISLMFAGYSAFVYSQAPVPVLPPADSDERDLAEISPALSLISEASPYNNKFISGSAKIITRGTSEDLRAGVVAGTYQFYNDATGARGESKFFARYEKGKLTCIRMSEGITELAECQAIPENLATARQTKAEQVNMLVHGPQAQQSDTLNVSCDITDDPCLKREYQKVYERIPSAVFDSVLSGYRSPVPGADYRDILDAIVSVDSRDWIVRTYLKGSLREVSIRNPDASTVDISGYYGIGGEWVTARLKNGSLACIQYWDGYTCDSDFVDRYSISAGLNDERYAEQLKIDEENYQRSRYNMNGYADCVRDYINNTEQDCRRRWLSE